MQIENKFYNLLNKITNYNKMDWAYINFDKRNNVYVYDHEEHTRISLIELLLLIYENGIFECFSKEEKAYFDEQAKYYFRRAKL